MFSLTFRCLLKAQCWLEYTVYVYTVYILKKKEKKDEGYTTLPQLSY